MKKPLIQLEYTEHTGILYPNLQISNDPEADQPLGRYGRMALEYLKGNHPDRYTALKMDGSLMETMHRVQSEATEQIETMIQQALLKNPLPQTEDTLARARHLNRLKSTAEEIVIQEIVLTPR